MRRIIHYFDYKSPYAYLAQAEAFAMRDELGLEVEWRPFTLDIPSYLGSAEVDEHGRVLSESRNAHQWRRVRYSYHDCRREAARRGLVLRGPRKIFDSSVAHVAFLFVSARGDFRPFHDAVFDRFWRRELDLENVGAIERVIEETTGDASGFRDFLAGEGRAEHDRLRFEAEERGVFGVPSWLVGSELFWGAERIPRVVEYARGG
jgi:2-hydroxychromene-2-carboxylate isomerase